MARILPFTKDSAAPGDPPVTAGSGDERQWAQWMRLAQAGDRATYQRLLQAIVPYLATIARSQLGPGDGIDDAVQDVLLIVHRVRHTYEPERPLKPWLATIARRHCIDLVRRRQRLRRHEIADEMLLHGQAGDASPERELERLQTATEVRRGVDALPQRQREAAALLKLDELSLREASERSGQSIPALKVGVHRALRSLRRMWESDDE